MGAVSEVLTASDGEGGGMTCDDRDVTTFAAAIRARRTAVGLTQAEVALIAGISRNTARSAEAGNAIEDAWR